MPYNLKASTSQACDDAGDLTNCRFDNDVLQKKKSDG